MDILLPLLKLLLLYLLYHSTIMDMKFSVLLIIIALLFHYGHHKPPRRELCSRRRRAGLRRSHRHMDLLSLRQSAPVSGLGREGAVASVLSACRCRSPRPVEIAWHELAEPVEQVA